MEVNMSTYIHWLNNNQGFVMCLLTFVYVVATIVIVYYNKKSIKEMIKTREEDNRPYVFANLEKDPRDRFFTLKIKNYGKLSAKINKIEIEPTIDFIHGNESKFLSGTIIAPGQVLPYIIFTDSKELSKCSYNISVDYESLNSKRYYEVYVIALEYLKEMAYCDHDKSNFTQTDNQLYNISVNLEKINNKL